MKNPTIGEGLEPGGHRSPGIDDNSDPWDGDRVLTDNGGEDDKFGREASLQDTVLFILRNIGLRA